MAIYHTVNSFNRKTKQAYNASDWTSGYSGTLGGFTAFFTVPDTPGELSHVPKAILSDMTSTGVTIRQVHRQEMPHPYGDCVKVNKKHRNQFRICIVGVPWTHFLVET